MTVTHSREEQIVAIKDTFISLMWIATRHFSQWIQAHGLTHPQFFTLASLACHKHPCTMRDLTEVTFQDPPTMTGIVDRLVKMKLVMRMRSETDRRVVLVQTTPAGVDRVNQIQGEAIKKDVKAYSDFSDEELGMLQQCLEHMLRLYVGQHTSLEGAELDAELERLQILRQDPINYLKSEDEKQLEPQS